MKYIYTLLLAVGSMTAFGQFNLGIGYGLGAPQQQMSKNIKPTHSLFGTAMFQLTKIKGLQVGADLSWGTYANERKEQTFNFNNGTSTTTWVNYGSNVAQGHLVAKYMPLKSNVVNPYIGAKAGYSSYYSTIYIEDPDDPGGCKALDQKTLIKDGTFNFGYGGGLQIDWAIFGSPKGFNYIDIGVNSVRGSNVEYINTKNLIDANNPPSNSGGKAVNATFINATTQEIHEHQIAEVYNTPMRVLEFKISAIFVFK